MHILWLLLLPSCLDAQETDPLREQQLESLAEKQDAETKDDSYWQQLDEYHIHRIDLNTASRDDLQELNILTDLQTSLFLQYRLLFGKLLHIYELQAVPGWDIETIRRLLPYAMVGDRASVAENFRQRLHGGRHMLLLRGSEQLERSKGFEKPVDSTSQHYAGSRQRIFFRYTYNYKNLLQYGILGDKDAGEQFFRGRQQYGFDFYSFHVYMKNAGIIRSLALGDFTVNMGQGLIQWQSLAFSKSAQVLSVKRQSPVLRPYHSAGEFNFHRGAGITLKKGKFEATVFASSRKVSANLVADTLGRENMISSFETSGYHRTEAENADRNSLRQTDAGANIRFSNHNVQLGINVIQYYFSHSIQKQDRPYNLYALQGKSWHNYSVDYSYTFRNFHLFGEIAADKNFNKAMVNGLLVSLHASAEAAIVYRNISKAYQSLYSDAFTENANPSNENGLYTGISIRPFAGWRVDAYADVYRFPWLKYRVDAPGFGSGFFIQFFYQPGKTWNFYTRFKNESKQADKPEANAATYQLALVPAQDWRTEYTIHLAKEIVIRNRVEIVWYNKRAEGHEQGFLGLVDFFYHPNLKPFAGNLRLLYFETSGYNSRIYAYENDMLYNFSIPFLYNKGFRYYINLNFNIKKLLGFGSSYRTNITGWIKWAQYIYPEKTIIGSGPDQLSGDKKSELKLQVLVGW